MDIFFTSAFQLGLLFQLVVLLASFVFIFLHNRIKSSTAATIPPGKTGWLASITEPWQFYKHSKYGRPDKFVLDRMTKHSEHVFATSLLGSNFAVLCGASGNKFIFYSGSNLFDFWLPKSISKLFPEYIQRNSSKSDPIVLRNLVYEFSKPEYLQHYIPIIDSIAKEHLKSDWLPHKVVKVVPLSSKFTFTVACKLFFGVKDRVVVTRLEHAFLSITSGLMSIPINLPGTAFNRAVRGIETIRKELIPIIRQRKKERTARVDALDRMLQATDENGRPMSEKEIADRIIYMLITSYDTSSTVITFIVNYLADNPHIHEKVFEEQMAIANSKPAGELLSWNDINVMKYSWLVVCEALRMTPIALTVLREAKADIQFGGFTIPKGWKIVCTPGSTHMNPEYFPNPEKFDPSRFEGNGPESFTYVPFGGGSRVCPGREYARIKLLVFMHNLVTKFNLEKVNPRKKVIYKSYPFPTPKSGLPVHLYPREI